MTALSQLMDGRAFLALSCAASQGRRLEAPIFVMAVLAKVCGEAMHTLVSAACPISLLSNVCSGGTSGQQRGFTRGDRIGMPSRRDSINDFVAFSAPFCAESGRSYGSLPNELGRSGTTCDEQWSYRRRSLRERRCTGSRASPADRRATLKTGGHPRRERRRRQLSSRSGSESPFRSDDPKRTSPTGVPGRTSRSRDPSRCLRCAPGISSTWGPSWASPDVPHIARFSFTQRRP